VAIDPNALEGLRAEAEADTAAELAAGAGLGWGALAAMEAADRRAKEATREAILRFLCEGRAIIRETITVWRDSVDFGVNGRGSSNCDGSGGRGVGLNSKIVDRSH
jgi:hypothetical protein